MRLNPVDYSPCPCHNHPPRRFRRKKIPKVSRRIKNLAIPKCVTPKHESPIFVPFKRDIEIIRSDLHRVSTRLEQLSIPKVRKLVAARQEYAKTSRVENLDKLIKKSLFSVYSRLANVRTPFKEKKPEKWTETEWKNHLKWLESRAKPKWPFDFEFSEPFTEPITKLPPRKVLMKRPLTPWIKEYEKKLEKMTKENTKPPIPPPEVWKTKREKLKTRPVTPYIEEYRERLRSEAAEMKVAREEKKIKINPPPREKWDTNERKQKLENEYKSRPKWVEKLNIPPGWIKEMTDKEAAAWKSIMERQKAVFDRSKIKKFGGRQKTLKLALATEEQREQVKQLLEVKKKETQAMLEGFQLKDPKMKTLPATHKLFKSIDKLSKPRQIREKFKFPENYNRFVTYF